MTLNDLRSLTLEWLDNPSGDVFAPGGDYARLDRIINEAYRKLTRTMRQSNLNWDIEHILTTTTISVTSAAREYSVITDDGLATGTDVRKIIDVVRTDTTNEIKMNIIPFGERFRAATRNTIYVYRSSSGIWIIGFVTDAPETQTLSVRVEMFRDVLGDASDIPRAVPNDWHSLIAVEAAILGMKQTGRDFTRLLTHALEEREKFEDDLGTLLSGATSQRF